MGAVWGKKNSFNISFLEQIKFRDNLYNASVWSQGQEGRLLGPKGFESVAVWDWYTSKFSG